MRPVAAHRLLPVLAVPLALAACGGSGGGETATKAQTNPTLTAPPTLRIPTSVDPVAARVIRNWADTLRRGDVEGAARDFALPSTVANGGNPIRLASHASAVSFNQSLPCGAKVTRLEPSAHDFTVATFTLTERPGIGTCGTGLGHTAQVAFLVKDGKIAEWIRLQATPTAPPAEGKSV